MAYDFPIKNSRLQAKLMDRSDDAYIYVKTPDGKTYQVEEVDKEVVTEKGHRSITLKAYLT